VGEIEKRVPGGVVQEKGLPDGVVAQGVLKRFFPASFGSLGVLVWGLSLGSLEFGVHQAMVLGVEVASLTAGFGLGLVGLKRLLYSDAAVNGRRSIVAGLCSPLYLGLASIFMQGSNLLEIAGVSILTGAGVSFAMFFPWLSRSPSKEKDDLDSPADQDLQVSAGPTG